MIKEIRDLTGLSHEKLGAWLGVSKSMVQFAEYGERSLRGEASKKLMALATVIEQLANKAKTADKKEAISFTQPQAFALQHKDKMDHHSHLANKLQRRLDKLKLLHTKLTTRFALLDAMKELDTEFYSSTETDKHTTELFEYFGQDHLKHIAVKLEPLQDKIDMHRAYAQVHKASWERFEQMAK